MNLAKTPALRKGKQFPLHMLRPSLLVSGFKTTCAISGEMYSIQHYVIQFVSGLQQSVVFSGYSGFLQQ